MIIETAKQFLQAYYAEHFPSESYAYNTYERAQTIEQLAGEICEHEGCPPEEAELLRLAALFQDVGIHKSREGHEQASVGISADFLASQSYPQAKIEAVSKLILATHDDHIPRSNSEMIIKDAVLSELAADEYFEIIGRLRAEWQAFDILHFESDEAFYTHIITTYSRKKHYTQTAAELFPKFKINMKLLRQIRKQLRQQNAPEDELEEMLTLNDTRAGQMIIKTALRNHLNLSELADRKASTMLSINSLIITIAIPLMLPSIDDNRYLIIPTLLLLIFCVTSILFATLVTKPQRMKGYTPLSTLEQGKGDLFFFGNFYKMSFEDYRKGMELTLFKNENLDQSVIRDLYLSGQVLGSKFDQLRLCYTLFLIGIISTIIGFVVVLLLTAW